MSESLLPNHYGTFYTVDDVKKSFRQYRLLSSERSLLPELIRTEKNNGYNSTTGAENLLKIRDTNNWSKCTITGLRPAISQGFYYGDLPVNGQKSLMVCYLSEDRNTIHIRICPQFYPKHPIQRQDIILKIVHVMNGTI